MAARYGVTTQAVYRWLKDKRIEGTRSLGGSWRIPAAQFERDKRLATSRQQLATLKQHLARTHENYEVPSEEELSSSMRLEN